MTRVVALSWTCGIQSRSGRGLGARMTGGGFGGCTINLVRRYAVAEFQQKVSGEYNSATGKTAVTYVVQASGGAAEINAHTPGPGKQPCA